MVEPIRYDICYMINIHSPLISFYSGHIMRLSGIESTEWKMTIYWSMMKVSILQNPYDSANSVRNVCNKHTKEEAMLLTLTLSALEKY